MPPLKTQITHCYNIARAAQNMISHTKNVLQTARCLFIESTSESCIYLLRNTGSTRSAIDTRIEKEMEAELRQINAYINSRTSTTASCSQSQRETIFGTRYVPIFCTVLYCTVMYRKLGGGRVFISIRDRSISVVQVSHPEQYHTQNTPKNAESLCSRR